MSLHGFLTRLIWLCVLPLGLLAAYLAIDQLQTHQAGRDLEAANLAENVRITIDQDLIAPIVALHMLALSPRADSPGRMKDLYLEAQAFLQRFGRHVVVADADRHIMLNTRIPLGRPLPMLPPIKAGDNKEGALETGHPAVSAIFASPQQGQEPLVAISVPSLREGKLAFVVITTVETSRFQNRLDHVPLPSGWSLSLLDGNGATIAHRKPLGLDPASDTDAARRFVVKSAITPWSVVLEIPRDIYRAPLLETALVLAIVILGATLIGGFGGMVASRRLGKLVAALAEPSIPGAAVPSIKEIAAVRRLLDESSARRESAERAQHESEQRFRATFEQAAMGIALLAPDGRWLRANQKLCEIVGYSRDELLSKTFRDISHPDDLNADLSEVRKMLAGQIATYAREKRSIRKDGRIVWINLTVALVWRADGEPDYFICVIEDISRRKDAESALKASELTLRTAQRLAGVGNWTWDRRSDQHSWSEELYRIQGRDPSLQPAVFPELQRYFTPAGWAQLRQAVEACMAQGKPYAFDAEIVRADGTHRWITVNGEDVRDSEGKLLELHGAVLDITDRKLANERLRISDLALKTISQGVLITTTDGKIISANNAFLSITGFSEHEVLGRKCRFLQGPMTDPATVEAIRLALANNGDFSGDILNYRKDGSTFWNQLSISTVRNEQGQATLFIGIIFDITARKLADQELDQHRHHLEQLVLSRTAELAEARDAAEAASRAKSTFLATMSHEIRTPLSIVLGLTGLLADSPLERRQRNYADNIQLSAQALRVLIDDVLDFSRIEAGALELELAPFSLNAILRTTAAMVSVSTRGKPVEVLFDVAPDLPDTLIGDALRLQQILLNLSGNAAKFTEAGEIVIAMRRLAQDAAQLTLQFAVRDTGIGIPPEQLGPVFDLFTQANAASGRLYGGSGLGLAISARLAALMGSDIDVESVPGQGSEFRFTLTLPLGDPPPAAEPALPGLRLLIVDDHPRARELLTRSCEALGWQASAVAGGAAGLAELRRSSAEGREYDLLLLDWRMPGMDGIEMLRQAQAAPDISLPLVVLMASAFEIEQAVVAGDEFYLDGILAKPIIPATLYDTVMRVHCGDVIGLLPATGKTDRRLAGMRLLVAEDNPLIQQVIEQVLTRAGAEVLTVADGRAAVETLQRHGAQFSAVLMDIQMPVMDGYAATRIIRDEIGLVNLPIIAVTAYAQLEDHEKSRRAGMTGHIVKPIDVDDLIDILTTGHRNAPAPADPGPATASAAIDVAGVDVAGVDVAGVDVGAALKAFGGDGRKYATILRQFVVDHAGDVDTAQRLFKAGDAKGAARLVHGLCGMASIVHAMDIAHLAAATEGAIGNADAVPPLFDELQLARRALCESIDQIDALLVDGNR